MAKDQNVPEWYAQFLRMEAAEELRERLDKAAVRNKVAQGKADKAINALRSERARAWYEKHSVHLEDLAVNPEVRRQLADVHEGSKPGARASLKSLFEGIK